MGRGTGNTNEGAPPVIGLLPYQLPTPDSRLPALLGDGAEPALALGVDGDRLAQVLRAEVGPEDRGGPVLGVDGLPGEVAAEAELPRRAHDQVGVGQVA